MIDRQQIENLPASRLAAAWLKNLKAPSTSTISLLSLTLEYLRRVRPEPGPNNYLLDLQQRAAELTTEKPAAVARLFATDFESLQLEQEADPDQLPQLLAEHLGGLHRQMQEAKSLREVGSLLAENLFNSLCFLSPSFGPRSA